jgi:GDP-L-fucose synthase
VQFDTTRADGQFRKPASNAKLQRLIGGFEFTPFDKGTRPVRVPATLALADCDRLTALNDTVKWFVQNYNNARTGKKKAA